MIWTGDPSNQTACGLCLAAGKFILLHQYRFCRQVVDEAPDRRMSGGPAGAKLVAGSGSERLGAN